MLKNETRKKISILKVFKLKKKAIKRMRIKYDIKKQKRVKLQKKYLK
jgi:hypothetical protein